MVCISERGQNKSSKRVTIVYLVYERHNHLVATITAFHAQTWLYHVQTPQYNTFDDAETKETRLLR